VQSNISIVFILITKKGYLTSSGTRGV